MMIMVVARLRWRRGKKTAMRTEGERNSGANGANGGGGKRRCERRGRETAVRTEWERNGGANGEGRRRADGPMDG